MCCDLLLAITSALDMIWSIPPPYLSAVQPVPMVYCDLRKHGDHMDVELMYNVNNNTISDTIKNLFYTYLLCISFPNLEVKDIFIECINQLLLIQIILNEKLINLNFFNLNKLYE